MKWKLNRCSYCIWLIYMLLAGFGLLQITESICGKNGIYGNIIYGVAVGVLLAEGLLVLIFCFIKRKLFGENWEDWTTPLWKKVLGVLQTICLLIILAVGILFRIGAMQEMNGGNIFEAAAVRFGAEMQPIAHSAEFLTVLMYRKVCVLFGNSLWHCVQVQVIVSAAAGILCYLGIRKLSGSFAALLAAGYYFLAPEMIKADMILSARPVILFVFGCALLVVGSFLADNGGTPAGYLLAGIFMAFAGYMDGFLFLLLIFAVSIWHADRKAPMHKWNGRGSSLAFLLVGILIGLVGVFGSDALVRENGMLDSVRIYASQYFTGAGAMADYRMLFAGEGNQLIWNAVIFVSMSLGIFSFFLLKKAERFSVWTAFGLAAAAWILGKAGSAAFDGYVVWKLILTVLAANALQAFARPGSVILEADHAEMEAVEESLHQTTQKKKKHKHKHNGEYLSKEGTFESLNDNVAAEPADSGRTESRGEQQVPHREETETKAVPETGKGPEVPAGLPGEAASSGNVQKKRDYNFVRHIINERKRKKEEQQREIEKILYALSSISADPLVMKGPGREDTTMPGDVTQKDASHGLKTAEQELKHLLKKEEGDVETGMRVAATEGQKTAAGDTVRPEIETQVIMQPPTLHSQDISQQPRATVPDTKREEQPQSTILSMKREEQSQSTILSMKQEEQPRSVVMSMTKDMQSQPSKAPEGGNSAKNTESSTAQGNAGNSVMQIAIESGAVKAKVETDHLKSVPQTAAEPKPVKPRMLDNPLPVPKKHVTTIMDYDYEVSDDDDYDYEH